MYCQMANVGKIFSAGLTVPMQSQSYWHHDEIARDDQCSKRKQSHGGKLKTAKLQGMERSNQLKYLNKNIKPKLDQADSPSWSPHEVCGERWTVWVARGCYSSRGWQGHLLCLTAMGVRLPVPPSSVFSGPTSGASWSSPDRIEQPPPIID